MTYENTCHRCAKKFDGVAKMSECYECFLVRIGEVKMKDTTKFWCIFCEGEITNGTHCVLCHEYKGAVTFEEFVEITGYEPKVAA